jgi:3-isopropylmalate/(R)-2-methylmalate dehydratase small subunit
VVISSRFADIFKNNSTKSGLLTVVLPQAEVEALWAAVEADPTTQVTVDLQERRVSYGEHSVPFEIDDYTRWRLLEGLDDVGLTERHLADIEAFEARRPAWLPKALPALPA